MLSVDKTSSEVYNICTGSSRACAGRVQGSWAQARTDVGVALAVHGAAGRMHATSSLPACRYSGLQAVAILRPALIKDIGGMVLQRYGASMALGGGGV